jgi:hypothetical protein
MPSKSAPGTVAMPGRNAAMISASGFVLASSRQKATSSAITPISVYPRTARKLAVWTSIEIRLLR